MVTILDFTAAHDRARARRRRAMTRTLADAWDAAIGSGDAYGWLDALPSAAVDGEVHRHGHHLRIAAGNDVATLNFDSSDIATTWNSETKNNA